MSLSLCLSEPRPDEARQPNVVGGLGPANERRKERKGRKKASRRAKRLAKRETDRQGGLLARATGTGRGSVVPVGRKGEVAASRMADEQETERERERERRRGKEKEERMHLDCSIGVGGHVRRLGWPGGSPGHGLAGQPGAGRLCLYYRTPGIGNLYKT